MSVPTPSTFRPPIAWRCTAVAVLAGLSVLVSAQMQPAAAQMPPCASRDQIVERLAAQFGERPVSVAVTVTGDLLELLTSPQGSWSIIVTKAGGPTCLMSAGEGWRGAPAQVAEDPGI
jgi:hypothetical protein